MVNFSIFIARSQNTIIEIINRKISHFMHFVTFNLFQVILKFSYSPVKNLNIAWPHLLVKS